MRWLLPFLLLIPFASSYAGFSDAASFQVVDNTVSVSDDAIYYQGWYSANENDWVSFTFPDAQTQGWILDGEATKTLPDVFTPGGEHYVLIYSCSKGSWANEDWQCYNNQWQILTLVVEEKQQSASIIAVSASTQSVGYEPELTVDGDLSVESRWSGKGDGVWIQYELNDTVSVASVSIAAWDEPEKFSFDISVSIDGSSWSEVFSGQTDGIDNGLEQFTFSSSLARFVRITGHGNDGGPNDYLWNSYQEVRIEDFPAQLINQGCVPNVATTCANKCGMQKDNCDNDVNCGVCSDQGVHFVYYNGFEHHSTGSYSDRLDDWDRCYQNVNEQIYQDVNDVNPTNTYLFTFSEGSVGLGGDDGFYCERYLDTWYDELYFSYKISFSEYFDPNHGGKLPFIAAVIDEVYAGNCPDGTDEFAPLLMFTGSYDAPDVKFYLYYPDMWLAGWYQTRYFENYRVTYGHYPESCQDLLDDGTDVWGETLGWYSPMSTDEWHTITMRVVANTPGESNGFLEGFIDGNLVVRWSDLRLRDIPELKVNRLTFSSFFGGSGADMAATKNEYMLFDDIVAYYFDASSGEPVGQMPSLDGRVLPSLQFPDEPLLG